jgi:hypothetical protein
MTRDLRQELAADRPDSEEHDVRLRPARAIAQRSSLFVVHGPVSVISRPTSVVRDHGVERVRQVLGEILGKLDPY